MLQACVVLSNGVYAAIGDTCNTCMRHQPQVIFINRTYRACMHACMQVREAGSDRQRVKLYTKNGAKQQGTLMFSLSMRTTDTMAPRTVRALEAYRQKQRNLQMAAMMMMVC